MLCIDCSWPHSRWYWYNMRTSLCVNKSSSGYHVQAHASASAQLAANVSRLARATAAALLLAPAAIPADALAAVANAGVDPERQKWVAASCWAAATVTAMRQANTDPASKQQVIRAALVPGLREQHCVRAACGRCECAQDVGVNGLSPLSTTGSSQASLTGLVTCRRRPQGGAPQRPLMQGLQCLRPLLPVRWQKSPPRRAWRRQRRRRRQPQERQQYLMLQRGGAGLLSQRWHRPQQRWGQCRRQQ